MMKLIKNYFAKKQKAKKIKLEYENLKQQIREENAKRDIIAEQLAPMIEELIKIGVEICIFDEPLTSRAMQIAALHREYNLDINKTVDKINEFNHSDIKQNLINNTIEKYHMDIGYGDFKISDEELEKIKEVIINFHEISISRLQRTLCVSYTNARKIFKVLEKKGLILKIGNGIKYIVSIE